MRKILGGLLGGKGGASAAVKGVLSDLAGDGVSDSLWAKILGFSSFEDILEEEVQREQLVNLVTGYPKNIFSLIGRCINEIESILDKEGTEMDEKTEVALVNSIVILAHILAAFPTVEGPELSKATDAKAEAASAPATANGTLMDLLWAEPLEELPAGADENNNSSARPLGKRVVDAAMRILFFEGFTIDSDDSKEEEGAPEAPEQSTDGVEPTRLWHDGIGPVGCEAPEKVDDDLRSNRQLGLQLLAAALVGGAPALRLQVPATTENSAATAEEATRRLVADDRPLAYLCDPGSSVPRRGELLYSLISVALGYDPHGYGLPYVGYFSGQKDESFVSLCLQVLGLMLQSTPDTQTPLAEAITARCPQEQLRRPGTQGPPTSGGHVFREMLANVSSEREVSFLVGGVITLLGTVSEERSTYFPSSMRLPPFLPELLVLVLHLTACEAFVQGVCAQGEASTLAESLLHAAAAPDHLREDTLALLAGAALLRLTAYREVCVALNEDFSGDVPDDLPDFQGTGMDLVMLAALKQAGDNLATAKGNKIHQALVEVHLCIVVNVSTYAEGLSMETCFRLFALFERCLKPGALKRGRAGVAFWLPYLLEAFSNIVQYQYGPSSNLVYGLMTRQAMFRDLVAFCNGSGNDQSHEVAETKENGTPGTPMSDGNSNELRSQWFSAIEGFLAPLVGLLDAVVPLLESEVEKKDISSPEDAKALLPRCVLGLLPVPHPFVTRNLCYSECTHMVCEHILVACVANGPVASLWDADTDEDDEEEDVPDNKGKASKNGKDQSSAAFTPPERKARGARERSSSRRRHQERNIGGARGDAHSTGNAQAPAAGLPTLDPSKSLEDQLKVAAASGVDVMALLQQLQGGKQEGLSPGPKDGVAKENGAAEGGTQNGVAEAGDVKQVSADLV